MPLINVFSQFHVSHRYFSFIQSCLVTSCKYYPCPFTSNYITSQYPYRLPPLRVILPLSRRFFISRSTVLFGIVNISDISAIVTALLDNITIIILSANPPFNPPFWRFGVLGSDIAALSKAESFTVKSSPIKIYSGIGAPSSSHASQIF